MTHIHLIGIGGSGISSIARVLLEKGYTVSGSDRILSSLALELKSAGAMIFEGHAAENIKNADLIVRSSAIPDSNVEVAAALKIGIPVLKRSDFLGTLLYENTSIAIAGSHGKTTTSAMMAWCLKTLGQDPSYILGGVSKNLNGNAHSGKGKFFVIEADEYDRMFLGLNPEVILLTNIGYDHPDCFPTVEDYENAFHQFVGQLKTGGILVANSLDAARMDLFKNKSTEFTGLTYGLDSNAIYRAENLKTNDLGGFTFSITCRNNFLTSLSLRVPGEHNVLNSLGVFTTLTQLGFSSEQIANALNLFEGTSRRFEIVGEIDGITIIDDYAHHPAKIQATLAAAKNRYPGRRIIAVWQPHTYSRTRALAAEFVASFHNADLVVVSEVYASREKVETFSSAQLATEITYTQCKFLSSLAEITTYLSIEIRKGDVLIVLSAGDANRICNEMIVELNKRRK
jgi:UDP-N-acetylmuramate--alanine ligase